MTIKKSMVDVAYDVLLEHKSAMTFTEIWDGVVKSLDLSSSMAEKKIAQFYTDLMLDSRFASLKDNNWDLRARRKYEETHVKPTALDDDLEMDDIEDDYVSVKKPKISGSY